MAIKPLTNAELLAMPLEHRIRALCWEALGFAIERRHRDERPKSLSTAIYNLRQRNGLGVRQLAERLSTNHATISKLEHGLSNTTPALLTKMAVMAESLCMDQHAEFFRTQARFRDREIRQRGGKR
jgi:DNA-binding transcriptional regulator YiaG